MNSANIELFSNKIQTASYTCIKNQKAILCFTGRMMKVKL